MKPKIIVVVGPTASGKSSLAVDLARKFNGEVVSADSRQVYTGLDIGTGKITKKEMKGVPHYLLDVCSPKKIFTAGDFTKQARAACESILARGKTPIICGGTGFYIDAFVGRVVLPEVLTNRSLRARLERKSTEYLYRLLQEIDPERARHIDRHNPRRLIRAIEIAKAIGKSPMRTSQEPYDALWIGLAWPKDALRKRIEKRLKDRIRIGMIAEGRRVHAGGLSYRRMDALGLEYRSLARYLRGQTTKDEMFTELSRAISQFAKRQMTYWRRNKDIHWISGIKPAIAAPLVKKFLSD